eukprot:1773481-Pyramimonas_sp.AAC.1
MQRLFSERGINVRPVPLRRRFPLVRIKRVEQKMCHAGTEVVFNMNLMLASRNGVVVEGGKGWWRAAPHEELP